MQPNSSKLQLPLLSIYSPLVQRPQQYRVEFRRSSFIWTYLLLHGMFPSVTVNQFHFIFHWTTFEKGFNLRWVLFRCTGRLRHTLSCCDTTSKPGALSLSLSLSVKEISTCKTLAHEYIHLASADQTCAGLIMWEPWSELLCIHKLKYTVDGMGNGRKIYLFPAKTNWQIEFETHGQQVLESWYIET